MNLAVRMAGLCGTSVFLFTAMPGFYRQIQPQNFAQMATDTFSGMSMLETIFLSLSGAIAAGFIGYIIGDIWAKPTGKRKKKAPLKASVEKPQPTPEVTATYALEESALSLSDPLPPPGSTVPEPPPPPPPAGEVSAPAPATPQASSQASPETV